MFLLQAILIGFCSKFRESYTPPGIRIRVKETVPNNRLTSVHPDHFKILNPLRLRDQFNRMN